MDLFSITCTTCKSRLKVRDQAAIGQILACPKCGGMVMVKPPPAFHEVSEQRSDLPTATEMSGPALRFDQTLDSSAFDVVEELLSDSPPKVQPPPTFETPAPAPSAALPPKPRFVGGPPPARAAEPKPAQQLPPPTTAHALPIGPAAPALSASPSPVGPEPTATKAPAVPARSRDSASFKPPPPGESVARSAPSMPRPSVGPRSYLVLMVASIALGIVLAVAAVTATVLFLQPGGRASAKSVAGKSSAVVRQAARQSSEATPTAPPHSAPASAPNSALPETMPVAAEKAPAAVAAATDASAAQTPARTETDPLELVKSPPAVPARPKGGDALARFDRILGGASDDPLSKSVVSDAKLAPAPPADAAPARPLAPRPPAREIDVARRLADPLPAIETAGTPLADFLQLMSDFSTIPITLELPFPPATAESTVVLRLANTTVGKALKEGLAPLRLEYVVSDDQLIVRREEPSPFQPVAADVKDLTAGDESQMNELAELLKAVVEPGVWSEAEGGGSITVDPKKGTLVVLHRRAVQGQVLVALEKLRSARRPALAHKWKIDPALFQVESRTTQAKSRLQAPISLNYGQPTRLMSILERLGEVAGVRLVVDWHDVAAAGWNPAGEATFVVQKQPLAAALDALLSPLDLTWRVIDARTLQVVTPARLADQGELECYAVSDLIGDMMSGEALAAKVQIALAGSEEAGSEAPAGSGNGAVRYEAEGKCLLAWLPQPKQRELEEFLNQWRGLKPK